MTVQVIARTRTRGANAGVFFRCRPGLLMEGYEVQIYNVCEEGDPGATGTLRHRGDR